MTLFVSDHSPHADHDGAQLVPQPVYMLPGRLSGDPSRISCIGGDLAVQCHGVFHHYIGGLRPDIVKKDIVDPVALFLQDTLRDLHAVFPEDADSFTADQRVGISAPNHDTPDPGLQDRFRAGGLAPMVTARLQGDINRRALG